MKKLYSFIPATSNPAPAVGVSSLLTKKENLMKKILLPGKAIAIGLVLFFAVLGAAWGQVSSYSFAQASGAYSAISGGSVLGTTANDDETWGALNIGFTFTFNGTAYTQFGLDVNGFITLGSGAPTDNTVNKLPLSDGLNTNIISALALDLAGQTGSSIQYSTTGTSPNRTLVIQWANYSRYGLTGDAFNFQIRLNETSNTILLRYGSFTVNSSTNSTAQVGLGGATSADYNNRLINGTAGTNTWAASGAGTANTSTCRLRSAVIPASGQTYTWTPTASITTGTITPTTYCSGSSVSVPFTSIGTYVSGNVYTAQGSNAAGSFASPTTIGTLTSTANSGTIAATIPANAPTGSGYRIRVISSTPSVTGSDNGTNLTITQVSSSIAPTTTQNINVGANGTQLTVTESPAATSRQWYYGSVSGGPYSTGTGITTTTYTPNFATQGTYYVVCISTFACGNVTSNEVQVNVAATITTGTITPTSYFSCSSVSVPFTSAGTFTANTYTAQLSGSTGSFASPTAIGTLVSNLNTGTITASIPAGTATGTGYRIRVISNSPSVTGSVNAADLSITLTSVSVAPSTTQNINAGVGGTQLTVTESPAATSRQWYYGTASGGPYATGTGVTTTTYTPNFATQGTYYVVCISTYACGNITSNQVQVNVSATITTGTITGSPFCSGVSVSVPFSSAGTFTSNTYTVQLSGSTGSFTSPTAIGTLVSNLNTGTISATIPVGTTTGTGYRIRVISSSPSVTGSDNGSDLSITQVSSSIAPATTQNINAGVAGTQLTVTESPAATSRQWYYGTTSGGPYTTGTGVTTTTYTPNFASQGTYYMVCVSTFACGIVTSSQVQVNVSATVTTGTITGSPLCVTSSTGAAVSVPFTSAGTFTGNTYTAQLSSSTGSFTTPVNIGTLVSNSNSGTITATIPAGTATGTGYLIRVNSNSPSVTGSSSSTITINLAANSVAPATTQNINAGVNGTQLSVTEQSTPASRLWYYGTASGGPYSTSTGITTTTYTPNFASQGTYYVVCISTFACGNVTSNQVQVNVSATIATGTITGSPFCVTSSTGALVSVPFTSAGTFTSNTYNAQLSSSAGSFTSPTAIGTLSSNLNTGTISATIPAGTATGTGYLIRVISSSPSVTGSSSSAITINLAANSVAPATTQNINVGVNGTQLTVTEQSTPASRLWYYGTASGGPYSTSTGITTTTYTPNFATQGTYYVVCVSTFACSSITSNQVTVNVSATVATGTISGSPFCPGASVSVPFTSAGTFTANTYTAQLSSAAGSFASPVNIGTLVSDANSGSIAATIPANTAAGTGYLIRVTSSNPAITGSSSSALTVNALPTNVTASASPNPVCLGSSTSLTSSATSNSAPVSLNYSEGFETAWPPTNWVSLNNGSGNTWTRINSNSYAGSYSMYYAYNSSNAADAWAITGAQSLVAGVTYTISFYYKNNGSTTFPEKLKVTVGTGQTVVSQSTTLLTLANITNTTYAQGTATFNPPTTGNYYFGFNCYSAANMFNLYVDAVTITGTASAPAPTYAWTSTPSGFTSALQNPTAAPTVNTTYIVTATNSYGCTASNSTALVTLNTKSTDPSSASASVNPTCGGATLLSLTGGGGGTGTVIHWYKSSNNLCSGTLTAVGTGDNLSVTPSTTTVYLGRYEDPAPCSYVTGCVPVTVVVNQKSADPTSAAAGAPTICNGQSTTLTLTGGGGGANETIKWYSGTCGGTYVGQGNGLSVSPIATTTYFGRYEDGDPCPYNSACKSVTITVNQPSGNPTSVTTDAVANTICKGGGITLTLNGGIGTNATIHWYTGTCDGTPVGTGNPITVYPTTNTTYFGHYEDGAPCTTITPCASVAVTVNQPSLAPTSLNTSDSPICNTGTQSVTLTQAGGTKGTGATWKWYSDASFNNFVGSSTSADASLPVSPATTTTYYLRAEGSSPCTSIVAAPGNVTVTVVQPSVAPTSLSASSSSVCNDGTQVVTLTQSGGTKGTGATWHWYSDAGFSSEVGTSTSADASLTLATGTPTTLTTYYLRAEGTSSPCSTDPVAAPGNVTVTVNTQTIPPTGISGNTTLCGGSTTLTATGGTLGTGAQYQWGTGSTPGTDPLSGQNGISLGVSPTSTTTYWVRIEGATAPCSENLNGVTQLVTVNSLPIAPVTAAVSPASACSGVSTSYTLSYTGGTAGTGGGTLVWYEGACGGTSIGSGNDLTITRSLTTSTTYYCRWESATCGSSACTSATVTVNPIPTDVIASATSTEVCAGSPVTLSSSATSNSSTGYNEGFDGTTFPPAGWAILDNSGIDGPDNDWVRTAISAYDGLYSMYHEYASDQSTPADAWAFTSPQPLTADVEYTISFWYKTDNSPEKLKLTVGSYQTIASQTRTLWDNDGGTEILSTDWTQATTTFTPTVSGTYHFGFNCYSDNSLTLQVDAVSINSTTVPAPLYQWTSSPAAYTSSEQNPPAFTPAATATYTVTVTNSYGCSASGSTTVTVRPVFTAGTIASTGQIICSGGTPTLISSAVDATGGDNNITYEWESSIDGFATAGTVISSATSATYTPPAGLTATTSYRRYAHDGTCNTSFVVSSGTWVVTVNENPTAPDITGTNTVCEGSTTALATTATGTIVWSSSNTAAATVNSNSGVVTGVAAGSTDITYTVTNGSGCSVTSAAYTVSVSTPVIPSVTITESANPITGGTSVTFTPSPVNGGDTPTYEWWVNGLPVGPGSTYAYTPDNNDQVFVVITSSLSCVTSATATSNIITMTVTPSTATTWNGSVSSAWGITANWSNGVPGTATDVTIPGGLTRYPTLTAAAYCNTILLGSTAAGTASILDNGFLHITTGNATVQRYIATDWKWHFLSSPVAAQSIWPEFAPTPTGSTITFGAKPWNWDFYYYNPNCPTTGLYWVNLRLANGAYNSAAVDLANSNAGFGAATIATPPALTVGKGYLVSYNTGWVTGSPSTHVFTGQLNTGTITYPIQQSATNIYNLVGNPYPSPINWDMADGSSSWDRSALNQSSGTLSYWVYDDAGSGNYLYRDFNGVSGLGTAGQYIAPGQGFFVESNGTGGTLTFRNGIRAHSTQSWVKSASTAVNNIRLKLTTAANTYYDEMFVDFNSEYSGLEGTFKMWSFYDEAPEIYSVKDGNSYSINRYKGITGNLLVPLATKTLVTSNYTITATNISDFGLTNKVVLEDLKTGALQTLNDNPVYTFAAKAGDDANRFVLHFVDITTSVPDAAASGSFTVYQYNGNINIVTRQTTDAEIRVTNMLGQVVLRGKTNGNDLTTLNAGNLINGVYVVSLVNNKKVVSQKIVVSK